MHFTYELYKGRCEKIKRVVVPSKLTKMQSIYRIRLVETEDIKK